MRPSGCAGFTGPFMLRRVKTDKSIIADLPEKLEMEVVCNLTAEQASLYQAVVDDMLERIAVARGHRAARAGAGHDDQAQAGLQPSRRTCCATVAAGRAGRASSPGSRRSSTRCWQRARRRCCSPSTPSSARMLRGHLPARFGREVLFLHGGVAKAGAGRDGRPVPGRRTASPPLFVLSLKAGGTGLTLTAANHVVHVDRWWNPAVEDQATDRAFRIGQTRKVQVRKLVCAGTVEEKIADDDP